MKPELERLNDGLIEPWHRQKLDKKVEGRIIEVLTQLFHPLLLSSEINCLSKEIWWEHFGHRVRDLFNLGPCTL